MQFIRQFFNRHFSDPQVIILAVVLLGGTLIVLTLGQILAPVLAGMIIAYLLEGLVGFFESRHMPRLAAVLIVFMTFMAFLLICIFALMPRISLQIGQVVGELPSMVTRGQERLMLLPERYPDFISQEQITGLVRFLQTELGRVGQKLLSISVASVRGLVTFLVYLVLLPLMVFFFMKDKKIIMNWVTGFLPKERQLTTQVWREVDRQIGNYIRGKFWEILIIAVVSYIVFFFIKLRFALLMALLVGLSVLVPYIGVTVTTFPIAIVGYYQWGLGSEFLALMIAYGIIQLLDGNLLAPLLLSEVVNLHPVAIIAAVLVFGGLWGFWGVFFAIPLATLVQAVLRAWPSLHDQYENEEIDAQTD